MVVFGNDWDGLLADEFKKDYYKSLRAFLKEAYFTQTIFPPMNDIFNAFKLTSCKDTKIVILGQDPYINKNEAHGLAFSVQPNANIPPSLANIFKELATDLNLAIPTHGCLEHWAKQGVLLLNTVLTVQSGKSKSHANKGWEQFTDNVLSLLNNRENGNPIVFMLWGRDAQKKAAFLNNPNNLVLMAAHPSPLARGAYFGSRHFSKANMFLQEHGLSPIDWGLPNVA